MSRRGRPGNRDRLQAVVLRKQGRALWKIVRVMGRRVSTVHRRPSKVERKGLDGGMHLWIIKFAGRSRSIGQKFEVNLYLSVYTEFLCNVY